MVEEKWYTAADWNFRQRLLAEMQRQPGIRILEIGAGRWPMFELKDLPSSIGSYTVNDIDGELLDRRPEGYEAAQFDMAGDVSEYAGRYDLVFSKYCAEHVRDGLAFHRNVNTLLKPGGLGIHLFPTLYASPFVANKLIPERVGHKLLSLVHPHRFRDDYPKFPAYYSCCVGSTTAMKRCLREIGYAEISVNPFYGHQYYDKIPVFREIETFISRAAARYNLAFYSAFAILVVRKAA